MSTAPFRSTVAPRLFAASRTIGARSSGPAGKALPVKVWNSRECGVRTTFFPARHFGSPSTALIASASRTIGRWRPRTISRMASKVPSTSPRPGPIATASARGTSSRICRRSSRRRRWPTKGCTMNAGEDLGVRESFEVRLGLLRVELVGRPGEQDRDPRVLREMAGRDEAVAAVVTGPAEDEHMLARGAELIPGDFRDGLSRVLHEIQDGDAEGLGVPIEDAHLERRDHPPRIRPSLVKRWPRG